MHTCQRKISIVKTTKGCNQTLTFFGLEEFAPEEMREIAAILNQEALNTFLQRSDLINHLNNPNSSYVP